MAGMPDGTYDMDGETVIVKGIQCRFPDGTIAGSSLTMDQAVRNFWHHTQMELWETVNMASLNPARSIGAEDRKGSLDPGKDADILITDADFNIRETYIAGRRVYKMG